MSVCVCVIIIPRKPIAVCKDVGCPVQVLSNQLSASLTAVQDKINSHQFRISQRLQWAAGGNPALNSIVDAFERAMNRRKHILQVCLCVEGLGCANFGLCRRKRISIPRSTSIVMQSFTLNPPIHELPFKQLTTKK